MFKSAIAIMEGTKAALMAIKANAMRSSSSPRLTPLRPRVSPGTLIGRFASSKRSELLSSGFSETVKTVKTDEKRRTENLDFHGGPAVREGLEARERPMGGPCETSLEA